MTGSIPLRTDYNANDLRQLSLQSSDSKQTRRLLALALIYDGSPRYEAARHTNVDVQSIRDWVLRFNAEGSEGLIDRKSTGAPARLIPIPKKNHRWAHSRIPMDIIFHG
ncbi:MAG: helix-turn-helix domain-containing protein [Rhodospirillales bacterium]|nr:helix-turn-helix domain-containing protein [Rhodospirillales bacterium]